MHFYLFIYFSNIWFVNRCFSLCCKSASSESHKRSKHFKPFAVFHLSLSLTIIFGSERSELCRLLWQNQPQLLTAAVPSLWILWKGKFSSIYLNMTDFERCKPLLSRHQWNILKWVVGLHANSKVDSFEKGFCIIIEYILKPYELLWEFSGFLDSGTKWVKILLGENNEVDECKKKTKY